MIETVAPKLTLVHLHSREIREVEVINFYPPAWLVLLWPGVGVYLANLKKSGVLQQVKTWVIKDILLAEKIYRDLSAGRHPPPAPIVRKDDFAAIQHWRDRGLVK
jgi:hypothetical protein